MEADNLHHGGICPFCYQTAPFVPVEQKRQSIQHLPDCNRNTDPPPTGEAHAYRMRAAALGMRKPSRGI